MAFRSKETMKKILKKVGEDNVTKDVKEALKKNIPNNKVVMGRAKRGLFGGRHIQFGNQISEDGGNNYILDRHVRVHVTTPALRCIDKAGGIDEYLLKTPYHKWTQRWASSGKLKLRKCTKSLGKWRRQLYGSVKPVGTSGPRGGESDGGSQSDHEQMVANA
ncbi:54S ribosomal protein L24 mitochondrial [Bienertia sinuspersici]